MSYKNSSLWNSHQVLSINISLIMNANWRNPCMVLNKHLEHGFQNYLPIYSLLDFWPPK